MNRHHVEPVVRMPKPASHQIEKLQHDARHKLWLAGRRARKSTTALVAAICGHGPDRKYIGALEGGNIWWTAPSYPMCTSAWRAARGILAPVALEISEAERRILLPGGGALTFKSASTPLVGDLRGIDGVVLDEAAQMEASTWFQELRPALSDRRGWSFWTTTPRGFNWLKVLFDGAADRREWKTWREPSTVNPFFDETEIEKAREDGAPDQVIAQEFLAEFVAIGTGRTYEFDAATHTQQFELDPMLPLDLGVSFKAAPVVAVLAQGLATKEQPERAIDEISAPSARELAAEFRRRYPARQDGRNTRVYGIAVGDRSTAASDFELLRAALPRAQFNVRTVAIPEKDRTNATNAILRNLEGEPRAFVAPRCRRLLRDLEFVSNRPESYAIDREPGLGMAAEAWGAKHIVCFPSFALAIGGYA